MGFFLNFRKTFQKMGDPSDTGKNPEVHVAVDLGQSHLLVLAVDKQTAKPVISNFRLEPRPASKEEIAERLKTIFREEALNPEGVRIALKRQGVVVRALAFPQMSEADFESALRYEIEKYIPFKADEVILDFQIFKENIQRGNAKVMETLLVAVRRSEIYEELGPFQNAGLKVGLIDVGAFAVANAIETVSPTAKEEPVGFLDVGTEMSNFGILLEGRPVFMRDISFGGIDLANLLRRKLGLDSAAIQAAVERGGEVSEWKPVLEQGIESLATELKVSIGYYLDHVPDAKPLQSLFLSGGGLRLMGNLEPLEQQLKIPARRLNVLSQLSVEARVDTALLKKNEDLLSVALGLCLRG